MLLNYVNTKGEIYATIITNLFDQKVVSWAMRDNLSIGAGIIPALINSPLFSLNNWN